MEASTSTNKTVLTGNKNGFVHRIETQYAVRKASSSTTNRRIYVRLLLEDRGMKSTKRGANGKKVCIFKASILVPGALDQSIYFDFTGETYITFAGAFANSHAEDGQFDGILEEISCVQEWAGLQELALGGVDSMKENQVQRVGLHDVDSLDLSGADDDLKGARSIG